MKINKGARIGVVIQIIAIIIMFILIAFNKIIPSVLVWIFNTGLVISLIGSLMVLSEKRNSERL